MSTPKISDKERSECIMKIYFPAEGSLPLTPPKIPPHILQVIEDFILKN